MGASSVDPSSGVTIGYADARTITITIMITTMITSTRTRTITTGAGAVPLFAWPVRHLLLVGAGFAQELDHLVEERKWHEFILGR